MKRLLIAALVVVVTACTSGGASQPPSSTAPTSGAATTGPPPWPAPEVGVSALAVRASLPMLPREALTEHIHAHLDIFDNGQPVIVPAYVGIDLVASQISPLHTHDQSGIVHIESPDVKDYFLGQFFGEWNVQMSDNCIAGFCNPATPIAVYVNGTATSVPFPQIVFHAHDEIAIVIGTRPAAIPTSFAFPRGY